MWNRTHYFRETQSHSWMWMVIGPIYTGDGSSVWDELGQRTVARVIIRLCINSGKQTDNPSRRGIHDSSSHKTDYRDCSCGWKNKYGQAYGSSIFTSNRDSPSCEMNYRGYLVKTDNPSACAYWCSDRLSASYPSLSKLVPDGWFVFSINPSIIENIRRRDWKCIQDPRTKFMPKAST